MLDNTLHKSTGILHYSGINRLAVNIEQDLADYYRSLIPKWIPTNRPRWPSHITVVREHKEKPNNWRVWNKYEGEQIEFFYSSNIQQDDIYFWLPIYCQRLEEIRKELGMWYISRIAIPPSPFLKTFHSTIANKK